MTIPAERRARLLLRATIGVAAALALAVAVVIGLTLARADPTDAQALRSSPPATVTVVAEPPGPTATVPAASTPARAPAAAGPLARQDDPATATAAAGRSLVGKVVVIDPGHNGVNDPRVINRLVPDGRGGRKACNTSGTSTDSGYPEHAHNWAVAGDLSALLRARGATVVLTRADDRGSGPCVDERAAIGNRAGADLVLSIHADGAAASAKGFHVIRSTRMAGGAAVTRDSARLAVLVRDSYARITGRPRSTYLGGGTAITPRQDIAGMNLSRVPAVMLEAGNMRNAAEARLLSSRAFHAKQAQALEAAAVRFLAGG